MRKNIQTYSNIFFVFKIHATHYPLEVYSNFSEMFNNSMYNGWTVILKHQYQCLYDNVANCVPNYQHLFTINDSLERYISVRLDYETGVNEVSSFNHKIILENPVQNFLKLDYTGRIQLYEISGKLLLDCTINNNEPINVAYLKSGLYFIKTNDETIKMIKL